MLVEFKVSNFQCFKDQVSLNLRPAGRDSRLRGNIWEGVRHSALKSAAVFGPNASGKTSLLHALYVLGSFVRNSATKMNIADPIAGIQPFRLAKNSTLQPSSFEVLVELDGVGHRYAVSATRDRVWSEVLQTQSASSGSPWVTLISREIEKRRTVLHERLGTQSRRDQIVQDTRENALLLSRAAERNVEPVLPLFRWFRQRVHHLDVGMGAPPSRSALRPVASMAASDKKMLSRLSSLVSDADTGILRVDTEAVPEEEFSIIDVPKDIPAELSEAITDLNSAIKRLTSLSEAQSKSPAHNRFFTEHEGVDGRPVRFSLNEESDGTVRYLYLASWLLQHCAEPNLLFVDELHTSLHPQLVRRVIQMLHSPAFGCAGTQMVFTTHDATLLDPELLRRDQILLTEKAANGAAEVYSLWDFEQMPRNTAAWARNYLDGRFGGIPVFGPTLVDVPQSDEPTPIDGLSPTSGGR